MERVEVNLRNVIERVHHACTKANRAPESISLLAATKSRDVKVIETYCTLVRQLGLSALIGENYIQEWRTKRSALSKVPPCHLIGPLQSNKARDAVILFDCIETIHSLSIAEAVNKVAMQHNKVLEVFIQINISEESAKSGFSPETGTQFVRDNLPCLSHLRCRGLMTITKLYARPKDSREDYAALAALSRRLQDEGAALGPELSMGMSGDFEVAIEEGATIIRIGSAIFGERESG